MTASEPYGGITPNWIRATPQLATLTGSGAGVIRTARFLRPTSYMPVISIHSSTSTYAPGDWSIGLSLNILVASSCESAWTTEYPVTSFLTSLTPLLVTRLFLPVGAPTSTKLFLCAAIPAVPAVAHFLHFLRVRILHHLVERAHRRHVQPTNFFIGTPPFRGFDRPGGTMLKVGVTGKDVTPM